MNGQHTPGQCGCRVVSRQIDRSGRSELAVQHCPLHGAAPELLEALKQLVDYSYDGTNPLEKITSQARAAIAKATGE